MRKVKKWRYYCEYCKKSGASAFHILNHEKSCTNNPKRTCKMCSELGIEQQPIEDLITALLCHGTDYDKGLEVLREAAENCPVCILAAIRQSKVQTPDEWDEEGVIPGIHVNFDFKAEMKDTWVEIKSTRLYSVYD